MSTNFLMHLTLALHRKPVSSWLIHTITLHSQSVKGSLLRSRTCLTAAGAKPTFDDEKLKRYCSLHEDEINEFLYLFLHNFKNEIWNFGIPSRYSRKCTVHSSSN